MEKNVLIVGGTSGIGSACVERFMQSDDNVFVVSRSIPDDASVGPTTLSCDIIEEKLSVEQLPDRIDALIYCPGTINLKPFNLLSLEDFRNDFEINCVGFVNVLQSAMPKLKNSESASVVAFSTVAVKKGMAFHSSVAASKGAIEGLVRSLAAEYASSGIRFNVIAPSMVETPLAEKFLRTEEKKEAIRNRHPLKKIGDPNEIAELVWFLTSNSSSWITGQVLRPDGGISSVYKG